MKRTFLLLILFPFFLNFTYSQEICNDGIDNDGDGFIDCFDGDCVSDAACDGFYIGNDASCVAEPNAFPQFSLTLGYESEVRTATTLNSISLGDLDRDGIPEIFTSNYYDGKIFILNGHDATIKHEASVNYPTFKGGAMANLEDDNCGEVFFTYWDSGWRVGSYDCELNLLWNSEALLADPVLYSFADFDRDGIAEMYYKDEIRDPLTGTRLVKTTATVASDWERMNSGPVAVDIMGDEDLELVIADKIYAVNLGSRTADSGSLTLLATMPTDQYNYRVKGTQDEGAMTSIADYNLDGNLDVIFTGATNGTPTTNVTTAFFWDVANGVVKGFSDPRPTESNYEFGWRNGMGRINIADIDGDGQLNATFISGKYMYALDENWEMLWLDNLGEPKPAVVNEETSGITGATLFDFNGDGKSEIVYRDEDYLYIMNGDDGSVNTSIPCRSRTNIEYPIVADVDADGSTEICIVCADAAEKPGTMGKDLALSDDAEVRIYKSAGEPWVPARRVWNQHSYFNVNVNDDLTIPQNQQKHQTVFSSGVCTTGPNRPLNNFLNQSPLLTSDGCYAYAAAELNLKQSTLSITESSCSSLDFLVEFEFENIGDKRFYGNLPVTFYNGDPKATGAQKLNTEVISVNLAVGDTYFAQDITVKGEAENFTLYVAINDNGSTVPSPITLPNSSSPECNYENNVSSLEVTNQEIVSITVNHTITSIPSACSQSDGVIQVDAISSANSSGFNYEWYAGPTASGDPFFTENGVNISEANGLSTGLYTVVSTDVNNGCSKEKLIELEFIGSHEVYISEVTDITSCDAIGNGEISFELFPASLSGVDQSNYTMNLFKGNDLSTPAVSSIVGIAGQSNYNFAGLTAGDYIIETVADEAAGGCTLYNITELDSNFETLNASISLINGNSNCQNPNGKLEVSINGGEPFNNFEYEWYEGNVVGAGIPIRSSSVAINLSAGVYTVLVTEKSTGCQTIASAEVLDETISPVVTAFATDVKCSDANSGIVNAYVEGIPAVYTFEWFIGSSEKPDPDFTGSTISYLPEGTYSVIAIDSITKCKSSLISVVIDQTDPPVIEQVIAKNNTSCDVNNPNGSASVVIEDYSSNIMVDWVEGVNAAARIIGNGISKDSLAAGEYSVVITNYVTGCKVIESFTIDNNIKIPNLSATAVPVTTCNLFNGRVTADVDLDSIGNYTFYWYEGSEVKNEPDFLENGPMLDSLASGLYTVQALNNKRNCLTDANTVEVADSASFTASVIRTENADFAAPATGSITIQLSDVNRDFEIFLNNQFYDSVFNSSSEIVIDSLEAGDYTIELLDMASTCTVELISTVSANLNTATDIISFDLPNIADTAVIDTVTHTVEIEVDGLTDVSSLSARIEISQGATISPNADEARDFTDPVFYTVTAQDGLTAQEWEVRVNKASVSKKDQTITFNLPDTLNQNESPYPLAATSSSGLAVQFSVESGSASILNNTLVLSEGSVVEVTAFQAGNDTLKSSEILKTVTVVGTFDLSINVKRPNGDPLEEGLAKLFNADGGLYQRQKFADGNLEFNDVLAGNYILQIIPTGELTSDIFPTYYSTAQLSKNASLVRVNNDLSLTVKMRAKGGGSNGNGQINGQVVKAEGSTNSRISIDETVTGEGISELVIYLLNKSTDEIVSMSVTEEAGSFSLQSVPKGSYDFLIDVPGMDQASTSFELPFDEQMIELNVTVYLNDDGIVDYDINIVLSNDNTAFDLNLYPNPTNGILFLRGYSGQEQNAAIVSSNGAVVKTFRIVPELNQELDVSDLEDGIYYLTLENEEGVMVKIIKQ